MLAILTQIKYIHSIIEVKITPILKQMNTKLIQKISRLPVITKANLRLLQDNKDASFDYNIRMWIKNGTLIKLKNGLYTTRYFLEAEKDVPKFGEYISSLLISPSYLSREYVMQKYNMLTEATYGFTAITSKGTETIINKFGNYYYSYIKDALFTGYRRQEYNGHHYYVASSAKALFDCLYFKKRLMVNINVKIISELRFNLEELTNKDYEEFEGYLSIARSIKMDRIYKAIRKIYVY